MKKLLLLPLLLFILACSEKADSTVFVTSPDGFAIVCGTGYTRAVPHLCTATQDSVTEAWTRTVTGCHAHTVTTIPATARFALVDVLYKHATSGAVNIKSMETFIYTDIGCGTVFNTRYFTMWEYAGAPAPGTFFAEHCCDQTIMPVVAGVIYTNTIFTNTGAGSVVQFIIMGYYD